MNGLGVLLVIIFLGVMLWLGPLLTILSLNYLFGLSIVYTFKAWLSLVWLGMVFGGTSYASKK